MLEEGDTGGTRRRSTFYVPLTPQSGSPTKKCGVMRTPSLSAKKEETPRREQSKEVVRPRAVLRRASPSKSPLKSPARPVLAVSRTIESPQKPVLLGSPRVRSPLLKVSAKLLSSSAQALEAIGKSPAPSPSKTSSSSSQRSPLALIRRSSSRKLARSSSTVLARTPSNKLVSKEEKQLPKVRQPDKVPLVVIEHLHDETVLCSAADKAQERRHVKHEEDEAVHSGINSY
jgi:hypothetical protein